ncbi:MAG TPA: tRNA (adenosine(37)-N6)-threonylcarbamoyltransferase complex dimerization subunit type 1 TsaB [Rhodopila sp.]|uniref:tRNA (adenosine(37)-N6)-threonylcarbamoyltransferase complex dimerization subunit type 1 TsaB n=1 Tax=Rhodopila sp. TaxID=2480087 RepID=UPI002C9D8792|nr:tRNA (adenosine(37)-N6)-threonylcarbamoyltransferase complex dimerization subunit type 1 TsaB [Rhodopila sp.]HVY17057.1 tRNA (adenosine(37)-N6)-threonylcarbamoyltransferase complex dimerization subunit type 1 TsaB [Rhodopila sp.]
MCVLAMDCATAACSATVVAGPTVLATRREVMERGQTAALPRQVVECLAESGISVADLDLVAVTVGPGSFTGTRSAVALAQGMALAAGIEAIGVTVGEALAESLPHLGHRSLWVATPSRRGRVFLETGGETLSVAVTDLPLPDGPVAVAGAAALDVASRLAARGADVMLTDARYPIGRHIAAVARRRIAGQAPALPCEPLYVDPPEARPAVAHPHGARPNVLADEQPGG